MESKCFIAKHLKKIIDLIAPSADFARCSRKEHNGECIVHEMRLILFYVLANQYFQAHAFLIGGFMEFLRRGSNMKQCIRKPKFGPGFG